MKCESKCTNLQWRSAFENVVCETAPVLFRSQCIRIFPLWSVSFQHWGRNNMADCLQATFPNAFYLVKMIFDWNFNGFCKELIRKTLALVQVMAWRSVGDKLWHESWHKCFIRPYLTHWGRVAHICVSKLTIIGSDNGLSPGRRQAIIWTNAGYC